MKSKNVLRTLIATTLTVGTWLPISSASAAIVPVTLGKAGNFAITSTGGFTNTGLSSINGDLGLTGTLSYIDSGLATLKGDYHFGDSSAVASALDVNSAYTVAASETPSVLIPAELGGKTLLPGVYQSPLGFLINGNLILDAQNNPNSLFIFQTPLTIATGAGSKVLLINGGQACNVIWQVGGATSIGATSEFKGTLLGRGSFSSAAGTIVNGRVLISQGAVALNATSISTPGCKKYDLNESKNILSGGGSFKSASGKGSVSLEVKGTNLNGTYGNISGKVEWNVDRTWKFKGVISAYSVDTAGVSSVSGTGTLSYYAPTEKKDERRWVNAVTGPLTFSAIFTREVKSNGSLGRINKYSIGFAGVKSAIAPTLPVLGTLISLTGKDD